MADVASRCQSQLATFRIRELKDVLSRLGLPKQGKKQILMEKIMGIITSVEKQPLTKGSKGSKKHVVTREEAIAVIDDAYRTLRSSGAELAKHKASKSGSSSGYPSAGPDERVIRCPCGMSDETPNMIQCHEPKCRVWQHINCVIIPEKPLDGVPPIIPSSFYCELCRIARGDPFCVAVNHPLTPTKLHPRTIVAEGSLPSTLQSIEKSFNLSLEDREKLHKSNYDLQVWCVLLNDKVSFRMHWPSYPDLRINAVSVRVTNRPDQQLLGVNGRDEAPNIAVCTREGVNRLSMKAYDARPFCIGVRVIRRCSLQQVMAMIPSEKDGEPFEEAMARVRRCINGGGGQGLGADDDDNDSDLEVVAESISVNLRCPMSGSRIKVAGRFKPCLHMGCFDLNTYVELNQRARKWQCPICLKNYSIEHLIIDPFFNRITTEVKNLDEDITEVELKADGSWRPKMEGNARFREPWRPSPAAVLRNSFPEPKPVPIPVPNIVKLEEGLSHDPVSLRLGIKRTPEGVWTVNGPKRMNGGPSQQKPAYLPRISRSSSATDSNLGADEDEHSVNQDSSENNVTSMKENDEVGFSSIPALAPEGSWQNNGDPPQGANNFILLSDTDDEGGDEAMLGSSGASVYAESDFVANGRLRSLDPSLLNDMNGDSSGLALGLDSADVTIASSSQSLPFSPLVNNTRVGMGIPDEGTSSYSGLGLQMDNNNFWAVPADNVGKEPYMYFPPPAEAGFPHHHPPVRPTPVQALGGRRLISVMDSTIISNGEWANGRPYSSMPYTAADVGNLDSGRAASPLRDFLPAQPARVQAPLSVREPLLPETEMDNAWFSLSLGGGDGLVEPAPAPSLPTTSQELRTPTFQVRSRDFESHGRASTISGNNGSNHRPTDSRLVGRSHFTSDGLLFPVRPRSSPQIRRPPRVQIPAEDSGSDT